MKLDFVQNLFENGNVHAFKLNKYYFESDDLFSLLTQIL